MKVHNLLQGSPEWLAYRAQHFNASDAPAMMGVSPYKTRAALLRELHTGVAPDIDIATAKRFENGHRAEALARPLAEQIIGEELYPVTGSNGRLSASFDGLTLDESQGFEHKALNAELAAAFRAIEAEQPADSAATQHLLPIIHRIQMEQQLHVSGAERILFVASEWSIDEQLIKECHCWYYPDAELRAQILRGWDQFAVDLAAYVPPEAAEPAPVGKAPDLLPALRIEVTGAVTASNLAEFKATALGAIRSVNRTLKTDQDFADAEKAVKWCADVEGRLKAAKEHALSQTADIDALFRAIDDITNEARTVRLDLDKLVTHRKTAVKEEAVSRARRALDEHIAQLNAEIAPMRLLPVVADFAGAIKGLKSVASMQDKLDMAVASAKIEADAAARVVRKNVEHFKEVATGLEALFPDLGQLVHKANGDFRELVQARVLAQQERNRKAEEARKAAEAQRIAEAEQRAREQEAARMAAEATAAKAAEAARITEGQHTQQVLKAEPATADATDRVTAANVSPRGGAMGAGQAAAAAPAGDQPATLKLGDICNRLGFSVSSAFVSEKLHIRPAKVDGNRPGLYSERQFSLICQALREHILTVATGVEPTP